MSNEMPDKNAEELLALFAELDCVMREMYVHGSILVVGGAAVALQTTGHRVTSDIDALFDDSADFRKCIHAVAVKHGFEDNWLNNTVKSMAVYFRNDESPKTVYAGENLTAEISSPEYVIALKVIAGRPQDILDILVLSKEFSLNFDDIRNAVTKYFRAPLENAQGGNVLITLDKIKEQLGG
jgi:hypothetical protein